MTRIQDTVEKACRNLAAAGVENARNEASWIVEHVTGLQRLQLITNPDLELTSGQTERTAELVTRRADGEPLQYILGLVDFRGWLLEVGRGVLIPRPETELLVDLALERYPGHGWICDMCTGSGVLALAVAQELRPLSHPVIAVDISKTALAYACKNVVRHRAFVQLVQADMFTAFDHTIKFQMITANPPYVNPADYAGLPADIRDYEPRKALIADDEGRGCLKSLMDGARRHLAEGGWLLSEIGEEQGRFCLEYARSCGFAKTEIHQDLTGRDRILAVSP